MPPGQHRLALMQTRKEHSRLEKALLQQQRDLRRLEEAYKTGMQLFLKGIWQYVRAKDRGQCKNAIKIPFSVTVSKLSPYIYTATFPL